MKPSILEKQPIPVKNYNYIHKNTAHDSSHLHVSGQAIYIDDIREPEGTLYAYIFQSTVASATITLLNIEAVKSSQGVAAVVTADDIIGINNSGPVIKDEPLLTSDKVEFIGQPIFAVAADTVLNAYLAAQKVEIHFQEHQPILSIEEAIEKKSFLGEPALIKRGNVEESFKECTHILHREYILGGQDHFYLEGQVALAVPEEDDALKIYSSTQHPTEVQHLVAQNLSLTENKVVVETRRMGGGFGGKETQAAPIACIASLLAMKLKKPVKLRLNRDDDMVITGKRHDFLAKVKVGFDKKGIIHALHSRLYANAGWSMDLSDAIVWRALLHTDNCYFIENICVEGYKCKTHTVSNTAFRGFGGPQGMFFTEQLIEDIAHFLEIDSLHIRCENYYQIKEKNITPYQQSIEDNIISEITHQVIEESNYYERKKAIQQFNIENKFYKKGIAFTPVKFGISFTVTEFNKAGALINIYGDGTIQLNHGGTEMGQGLFIKVAQAVAEVFQVDLKNIRLMPTSTEKIPNTSATAASSGCDLNAMAAVKAAYNIRSSLVKCICKTYSVKSQDVRFINNSVIVAHNKYSFQDIIQLAIRNRVSLSATGFYKTPKIHWDKKQGKGHPFFYFCYGAAVSEAIIDVFTGENKIIAVDIVHDCGNSLNEAIDRGQIEGGYIQGNGWLTSEELYWDTKGKLQTHAPSSYKIPTCKDIPERFNVSFFRQPNRENTVYKSKAVGEPPFMLAISSFLAIKNAITSLQTVPHKIVDLQAPATPEKVLMALEQLPSEKF